MSAIEAPPPSERKRPTCNSYRHQLAKHGAEGAVILCGRCQRWLLCRGHYPYAGCLTRPVKWWDFRLQGRIKAYLERGDRDGEAE